MYQNGGDTTAGKQSLYPGDTKLPAETAYETSPKRKQSDIEQRPGVRTDTDEFYTEGFYASLQDTESKEEVDFDSATRRLHKMVRHWLGLRQDCEDLLAQLHFLHETHIKLREKRGRHWQIDRKVDPGEAFEVLISQCDICVRWTQCYHDRTQTRINLV